MLVPSTFTGWYRNRITTIAISTLIERSRIQESVSAAVDLTGAGWGLSGSAGPWPAVVTSSMVPNEDYRRATRSLGFVAVSRLRRPRRTAGLEPPDEK